MRASTFKVGETPTKLITFIEQGLKVFVNMVDCEKAKVHQKEMTQISKGWQPMEMDFELNSN
jgi:hypothetical protein